MSDTKQQTRLRPVIRVFVSSTFSDMKRERNALASEVFPKLELLCQRQGFQFQAIDLRWGVSTEAGLDHRTMRICFDELRRAQEISPEPNFLVLLGNRYGWRPLPESISHDEFEKLATVAKTGGEKQTPLPGAHGKTAIEVLGEWYRCDQNVVLSAPLESDPDRTPLNYLLQPRTQSLGDGRDYKHRKDDPTKDTQDWIDVQDVLWRLVNATFPATGRQWFSEVDWAQHITDVIDRLDPKRAIPQIARFQASATEQEIWCGALSAANAERHVIACFREIANRDDFAAADVKEFFDVIEGGFDAASAKRQSDLKTAVKQRLGEDQLLLIPFTRLKCERGKVFVDASEVDTKAFCDAVYERFHPIIERQIEEYWDKSAKDSPARVTRELKIERDEHERFGRERGGKELFVGRNTELETIRTYLSGGSKWPLVVHGSSGCGKTALLWRACEDMPEARKPIIRLIGTTPNSSDLRSLLCSLCQQLRQRNPRADKLPTEIKELREELCQHLQVAKPEQPLILFLDALDQLADADNGRQLNWLPLGELPAHAKLVVSCLSDRVTADPAGQPYAELKRRQIPAGNFINLDVLSEAEAHLLLFDRWLPKVGRKVRDDQRALIQQRLASPACRQPIYLKLLFEEVQLWHSFDPAPVLGESVSALFGQIFDRLSQPTNHGPLLVDRVMVYLSASRHGLAENEIVEILFADPEYRAKLSEATEQTRHELPPNARRVPIVLWSRLRFDLAPYLAERAAPGANVLTFYHRQVAEWVQENLVAVPDQNWQPHSRLADYFCYLADPERNHSWKGNSPRSFLELPFHLVRCDVPKLVTLLCCFDWLQAKTRHGLVREVIEDFDELLATLPPDSQHCQSLGILRSGLRLSSEAASEDSNMLAGQIVGRLSEIDDDVCRNVVAAAMSWRAAPWLMPLVRNLPSPKSSLVRTFRGQVGEMTGLALTPDCRIAISAGRDGFHRSELHVWDIHSGVRLHTFAPPRGKIRKPISTPDGQFVVFLWESTVAVLDLKTGDLVAQLQGHQAYVRDVALFPDGRRLISASDDNTLRIWDLKSGTELASFVSPRQTLSVAVLGNGNAVVAGSKEKYGTFQFDVWDIQNGVNTRIVRTPGDQSCWAVAPDGSRAILGTTYGRIWEIDLCEDTWNILREANPWGTGVTFVVVDPSGQMAAEAISDGTIIVCQTNRSQQVRFLKVQPAADALALGADGRTMLSGSHDGTLTVLDLSSGASDLNPPGSHLGGICALALNVEETTACSASSGTNQPPFEAGEIKLWDVRAKIEKRALARQPWVWVGVLAFDLLSTRLVVGVTKPNCADDGSPLLKPGEARGQLKFLDCESGDELRVVESGAVLAAAFTLNNQVASLDEGSELNILEWETGQMVRKLSFQRQWTRRLRAVFRDGKHAMFDDMKRVCLSADDCLPTLSNSLCDRGLALAPNERLAMTYGPMDPLTVWNTDTGEKLHTLLAYAGNVNGAAITYDSSFGVTCGDDKVLRVWNLVQGNQLCAFYGMAPFTSIKASLRDSTILVGDASGCLHFFKLVTEVHGAH